MRFLCLWYKLEELASSWTQTTATCKICGKIKSIRGIASHVKSHEIVEIKCDKCETTFSSRSAKANHVRWIHKESKYSEQGLQTLKDKVSKATILRAGLKITKFGPCPKCNTIFKTTYYMRSSHKAKNFCSQKCANGHYSNGRICSIETKSKISSSVKKWQHDNPEKEAAIRAKIALNTTNRRFSSKAERELAVRLTPYGFHRHHYVRTPTGFRFDVDIVSNDGKIWVESDGEWHYRQVHKGHDFEKTQLRDMNEAIEAKRLGIKLIRLNNQELTIDEQVDIVLKEVKIR